MELYAGLDLHSRNTYIGVLNKEFNPVFKKRVSNDIELILETLNPFRDQLNGLVVESTFNWYWLVDGLMDAGYQNVHLANPSAIKQYEGLKFSDDQHDAFFLSQLSILGILPQGYIYPKKERPVRDLACKRLFLVRYRTAHKLSLQSLIRRCCAYHVNANEMRTLTDKSLRHWFKDEHLFLTAFPRLFLNHHHVMRARSLLKVSFFSALPAHLVLRLINSPFDFSLNISVQDTT